MEFDYDHIKPARVNGAHSATLISIDRNKRTAVFLSSDKVTHQNIDDNCILKAFEIYQMLFFISYFLELPIIFSFPSLYIAC